VLPEGAPGSRPFFALTGFRDKLETMRKRLIPDTSESVRSKIDDWLDLEQAAVVEVTSEDKDYPVESALSRTETGGWRAATPGVQTIRLVFDQPQSLKRISLVFEENETARTQEFVLRCSSHAGNSFREIVRQQWNFSPPQTARETEEYEVELSSVTVLELIIVPNISGGPARASLKSWRLG
jgi:XRCC1 N terminal domain